MSDILKVNCWILDEKPNLSVIKIPKSETVDDLKEAILSKTKSPAAAHKLFLWNVSEESISATSKAKLNSLKSNIAKLKLDDEQSLPAALILSDVFSGTFLPNNLHIVVQVPEPEPNRPPEPQFDLNCSVLGGDGRVFSVKIAQSASVDALKDAIKKKKEPDFDHAAADRLDLWKVNINLETDFDLLATIESDSDIPGEELKKAWSPLSNEFTDGLDSERLHIIVRYPPIASLQHVKGEPISDEAKRLQLDELQKSFIKLALTRPSPSSAAKSSNFAKEQHACPMLIGRPFEKQGLPVGLYNPIFDEFKTRLSKPKAENDVAPSDLARISTFCTAAVAIHRNEDARRQEMEDTLAKILQAAIVGAFATNRNRTNSDGVIMTIMHEFSLYRAVLEWKNDLGDGGCDAVKQACFSFRNYLIQHKVGCVRNACNCPCFLIVISGPWMVILGAVFVEYPVIQPLTDYIWLGVHPSADDQLLRIARVLLALRHSLKSLDNYYQTLNIPTNPGAPSNLARFFPHILAYPTMNGNVQFEYLIKLADESPTKAIFKAKTVEGGDHIVVKFVQTYNYQAHRLLAAHNLAPQLLYPETTEHEAAPDFGGLKLVVMRFVDGVTAHDVYGNAPTLPDIIFKKVEEAVTLLHKNGLVFGDLRPPNIMILEQQALLVDFDWCAKDGEGRYPVSLNDVDGDIGWHPDVKRGSVMYKKHDLFMLGKLRRA